MNSLITHTESLYRQDSRWKRPLCFLYNLRSVVLDGRSMTCDEQLSVLDGLPTREQVGRFAHIDVGAAVSRILRYVGERVMLRVHEARITTLAEMLIVGFGWSNVYLCIVKGGGYTQGWSILEHGISQPAYGWILAVQCVLRGFAIFFLPDGWRYFFSWTSLIIHGTTAFAVYAANPASQALAALLAFGVVGNLCIIGSFVWAAYERSASDLGTI